MAIFADTLQTTLDKLSSGDRKKLVDEIKEDRDKGKFESCVFFEEATTSIYNTNGGFRLDRAPAKNPLNFPADVKLFYVQLQKGSLTYANVRYCETSPTDEIIDAIILSLEKNQGYYVV